MISFRDETAKRLNAELIVYTNEAGKAAGVTPFTHGGRYTDIMKTEALKQALDKYGCDAAIGGARRDEEKSRAKERVFSFRDAQHRWDPKNQRPELWNLYNGRLRKRRQHPRVPAVELDRDRHLDLHPRREHSGRAAVFREAASGRRSRRAQDHGGRRASAAERRARSRTSRRCASVRSAAIHSPVRRCQRPTPCPRSSKKCCAPRPPSGRAAPSTRIPRRPWRTASAKDISRCPPSLTKPVLAASLLPPSDPPSTLEEFLAQQRDIDLLRFITCGSVDDGKSTLIGRLLHDTAPGVRRPALGRRERQPPLGHHRRSAGSRAAGRWPAGRARAGHHDRRRVSLLLDAKRKFIVADCPGHEQYTRNMATGASTAEAAVVLVDAEKGVRVQTRRHAHIVALARRAEHDSRGQQDGPHRLRPGEVRSHRARVRRLRAQARRDQR